MTFRKRIFCLFATCLSIHFAHGQIGEDSVIQGIRQVFQQINKDSTLRKVVLDEHEFLGDESGLDNGAQLNGYFRGNTLCKMTMIIGLSFAMKEYDYYFRNGKIIFIYETERDFQLDKEGTMDYGKSVLGFEGRYYYDNGKLIMTLFKGKKRMDEFDNKKAGYVKELPRVTDYIKLLIKKGIKKPA